MNSSKRSNAIRGASTGMVIGAIALIAFLGLVAWRVWSVNTLSGKLQKELSKVSCDLVDKDICKFLTSWQLSTSYKVIATNVNDVGKSTTSTYEASDSGKKYHVAGVLAGARYEAIGIGTTVYVKDSADGKWWKRTVNAAEDRAYRAGFVFDFPSLAALAQSSHPPTYQLMGKEACDKRTCFKYQVIDQALADQIVYIWFDTDLYQLRRMHIQSEAGNTDMTFAHESVTINAPTSTKVPGAGQMLVPLANSTP